jgi:hypothetical protein
MATTLMDKIYELDLDDVILGKRDPDAEEKALLTALASHYLTHIDSEDIHTIIDEINANADLEIDDDFDIEEFKSSLDVDSDYDDDDEDEDLDYEDDESFEDLEDEDSEDYNDEDLN